MKILGNTSATFEMNILPETGQSVLMKTAYGTAGKRLQIQCNKQQYGLKYGSIEPVKVIDKIIKDDSTTIVMPYISSGTFIDFAERSSVADINDFATNVIDFVNAELNEDTDTEENTFVNAVPLMQNKLKEVREKFNKYVNDNGVSFDVYKWYLLFEKTAEIIEKLNVIKLIERSCHGDLTLSNILFSNTKYYLIDYLDSYIESPVMDIIKLRQDTLHKWVLLMTTDGYDKMYINIVLDYLDKRIQEAFSNCDWYKYYNIFAAINMFRILPYSLKDGITSKKVTYLYNEIAKLIN